MPHTPPSTQNDTVDGVMPPTARCGGSTGRQALPTPSPRRGNASDAGVDQRADRTGVDHRREREVAERRGAHDHGRQPGLGRECVGFGDGVEAMPQ